MNKNLSPRFIHFAKATFRGTLGDRKNCVLFSFGVFKTIGLQPGTKVFFRIGNMIRETVVDMVHASGEPRETVFFLSPDITEECNLPTGTELSLRYVETDNMLHAGPLIGLFTVKNLVPDTGFGSQEASLTALVNSAAQLPGFVFVFCPEDVDRDRFSITGYIPVPVQHHTSDAMEPAGELTAPVQEQGTASTVWLPLTLPLPDAVYDRLPSRSIESRPEVKDVKTRLQDLAGIIYFNPMFLNKWETHLALQTIPEVADYLPPTKLVETNEDIAEFLDRYGSIFLKPSTGSLGRRIIKVSADQQGFYRYMYRSKEKNTVEGITTDFNSLVQQLKPLMGKRIYVVQRDLNLARFEDCPFDIRVLVQKDMWGKWRRTKIYVRKAAPNSFLSNLSDGARPKSISAVLKDVFDVDFTVRQGLGEEIRRAVNLIPPALENGTGQIWGELGIDLGLDCDGRIWLIEINSKPFRALVSENGSSKIIERSLMRPLEFSKYLTGFYRHSPFESEPCSQQQNEGWF